MAREYVIDFGNLWRECKKNLLNTIPMVNEVFREAGLEDRIRYYESALPSKDELWINFMIRNNEKSFASPVSIYTNHHIFDYFSIARFYYYVSKIPILKKAVPIIDTFSARLYLGQKRGKYLYRVEQKETNYGKLTIVSFYDFSERPDLDFIVSIDHDKHYLMKIIPNKRKMHTVAKSLQSIIKEGVKDKNVSYYEKAIAPNYTIDLVLVTVQKSKEKIK